MKHGEQVRQGTPHMLLSPACRPSVAAADRQVSVDETVDDLLVENSVYISLLRVQDSAQRVFEFDVLAYPRCGARMRIIAAIDLPEVIQKIPSCLGLPTRAPPIAPAIQNRDAADLWQAEWPICSAIRYGCAQK